MHEALREPFDLDGTEFYASASLGICLFPQDAHDAAALLQQRRRRHVPEQAQTRRAATCCSPRTTTTRWRRWRSPRGCGAPSSEQHWVLHYQPILDLGDGDMRRRRGARPLAGPERRHRAAGRVHPARRGDGADRGDRRLGDRRAAPRSGASGSGDGLDLEVSFNLSPRQLWSPNLAEHILGKLQAGGMDPGNVVVEITESTAMADPDRTQRILAELHAWGLTLAIDDFGTGYSSLARLKHMPVDILKIDQSFVRDVDRDRDLAGMVRAMIQLAQSLGMTPLAEGIETRGEYEFLRANGCRLAQGFLFAGRCRPPRSPRSTAARSRPTWT